MPTTLAKLYRSGEYRIKGEINERLPSVTSGLVAHFPFDGKGGTIDVINGTSPLHNTAGGVNILDCLSKTWKNPTNWSGGTISWDYTEDALKVESDALITFNVFIPIDTSKHWYIEATMKQGSSASGGMYLGTISYDANYNVLPGHPGTYDYFGNVGSAITTTWVTYNNNVIGGANGNGRTGEDANTNNYAAWHPGTKFAKILIITNYNGRPGPTWIKDLKFYYKDNDNSNCTITHDSIAIEEGTTNIISDIYSCFDAWGGMVGTSTSYKNEYNRTGIYFKSSSSGGARWYNTGSQKDVSPSTTYSISAKIKYSGGIPSQNLFYLRQYRSDGSQISEYGLYTNSKEINLQDGWKYAYSTFTTAPDCVKIKIEGYEYVGNMNIWIEDLQVEQKAYFTSYTSSTRSPGVISLPAHLVNVNRGAFAIDFFYNGEKYSDTGNKWMMITHSSSNNGENDKINMCIVNGTLLTIFSNTSTTSYTTGFSVSSIKFNEWNTYVVSWDKTNGKVKECLNGTIKEYTGLSVFPTVNPSYFHLGGWCGASLQANMKLRNFSIYNKYLSDQEIKKLCNKTYSITKQGEIMSKNTIEKPNAIPNDAYYFPLNCDTYDYIKAYNASESTNLEFENGAVWVGSELTNLVTNIYAFSGYHSYSNDGTKITCVMYNNDEYLVLGISGITGKTISVRGIIKKNGKPIAFPSSTANTYNSGSPIRLYSDSGTGYFEITSVYANDWLFHCPVGTTQGDIITLEFLQAEEKIFCSAYNKQYRGTSSLEFNLNSTIGLDWSGNWSIVYFKKPVGTHDNTLNGYNIESIGCNGNSVGGCYIWWGKENGANMLCTNGTTGSISNFSCTFSDINNQYFNQWSMVSIVKNGTTITIKEWLKNGVYAAQYTGCSVPANGFVTQYGYDLKLGGLDNGNPVNSYYRDLIVSKRALSDNELNNIYRTLIRQKNGIQIQHNILENSI